MNLVDTSIDGETFDPETCELENGYLFRKFSFGEQGQFLTSSQIVGIVDGLIECTKRDAEAPLWDAILTTSPGGIQWATAVGYKLEIPVFIARDNLFINHVEAPTEELDFSLGKRTLSLPFPIPSGRILFLDDVMSSGNTLRALQEQLNRFGQRIERAVFIASRKRSISDQKLINRLNVDIYCLAEVE